MIRVKRTCDPPARGDAQRIFVERLWPRGVKKEMLAADAWMKDVAPSTELRKSFDHRVERWEEFGIGIGRSSTRTLERGSRSSTPAEVAR